MERVVTRHERLLCPRRTSHHQIMGSFPTLPDYLKLEHDVARILTRQELHGWRFDLDSAWKLAFTLGEELRHTEELLRNRHPFVEGSQFTPKRANRRSGYVEGATFTRLKELNPSSRDHIAWILQQFYGWKPKTKTTTGKPVIDEVILKEINSEVSLMFLQILTIRKMLGMIQDGENAWMKLCTNAKRIHHHCSVATNTHRCAHRRPNLGQVPSDERFRKLFIPSPGLGRS